VSSLEALLERSRKPGAYVERRRFTLSREKAVEKQRAYALRNETQYILELVQAAVLAGASFIAIDIKPATILVAFIGGRLIQEVELQSILDYLFADRGDPKLRHLVQLAIGINALLQRRPRVIRMESGDGENAVRLELDIKGNGEIGQPAEPISGTYMLMERDLGFWESLKRAPAVTEEEKLVAIACSHTPVPIIINGKAPFGYTAKREIKLFGIAKQHFFDRDGIRGVLAVDERVGVTPRFKVVIGGCVIVEMELPELGTVPMTNGSRGMFFGVVADDRLRKTADQADIVRDARLTRVLRVLQEEARAFALNAYGVVAKQILIPPAPEGEDTDQDTAEPAMAPLGDSLLCLGPLESVPLAMLEEAPEVPVYWVDPLDQGRLALVADPAVFPFTVLILEEPELRSLLAAIPSLSIQRLSSAADVAFVGREVGRDEVRDASGVSVTLKVSELGLEGTLRLTAHGDQRLPPWGSSGQVPLCIAQGELAQVLTALSLPFKGVSAHLSLQSEVDPDQLEWLGTLTRVVQSELWRLVLACPENPLWSRELCAGLLGAQARPRFERLQDGQLRVHAALPPEWGEARSLAQRPLDEAGWTLDRVVALWNGEGASVASAGLLRDLAPLLESLGGAHLHGARSRVLFGLSLGAGMEREGLHAWLGMGRVRDPVARVVFCESRAPLEIPEGWSQRVGPTPRVRLLWRDQAPVGDVPFQALLESWQDHSQDDSEGHWPERLALAQVLGAEVDPELLASDGQSRRRLSQWVKEPGLRVAAFGGVGLREAFTLQLPIDPLRALEATLGQPLTLRFDDAPAVWESLLAPAEQGGWLLREPLQIPGVRGWLGLRLPYDGTGGVLVRDPDGAWMAMPELDARLPCHGLVWITDSRPVLSASQEELMALCALQMYQRLAEGVRARAFGKHLKDARFYAMRFCWLCAQQGRAHLGTVRLLAGAVVLEGVDGKRWGTLDAWLDAPEGSRPDLPIDLPAPESVRVAPGQGMAPEGGLVAVIRSLVNQVDRGIQMTVQVTEVASPAAVVRSGRERLHLQLNTRIGVVREGLAQEGIGRELVAMEAARQIALWGGENGIGIGLGELQQVLLARKLRL
jgi:hypothetical protein